MRPSVKERLVDWLDWSTRAHAPTRRIRFRLARDTIERFAAGRSIRVLDAGCSEGLFSELLARRHPDWSIDAVDVDEDVLEQARSAIRRAGLKNVHIGAADLTKPVAEGAYDAVAALEFLTLVDDDEAALTSLARALKPGGLFVGHVPEKHWRPVVSTRGVWPGERKHGYTAAELQAMLQRANLEVVSITATSRRLSWLGREVSDRVSRSGLPLRLFWFPFAIGVAWLDPRGITWGPAAAFFVEARARTEDPGGDPAPGELRSS